MKSGMAVQSRRRSSTSNLKSERDHAKTKRDEYVGETSGKGKREGQGILKFKDGDLYEGGFKDGKMHGKGRYKLADGDVYEGTWVSGAKHGPGTYWYASGRADVVSFNRDADESEGARWAVDRSTAWRLDRGEVVEEITIEEAAKIAERLGEPVPPQISAVSPILRATGAALPDGL